MNSIYSSISLMLIFWLAFFLYQSYRVDKLRQDLFKIRDQLFDDVLDGKIKFDDSAYIVSRQLVNGMIRFAHRLSIPSMLAFAVLMPRNGSAFAKRSINEQLGDVSVESAAIFRSYLEQINARIVAHVVSSPLFVITALVPLVTLGLTKFGIDITGFILKKCRRAFQVLDNTAYAQGASV